MNQQAQIPIHTIQVINRKRPASNLDELKRSISELGLLNPITVTTTMTLVAGYHRLTACTQLGWTHIDAHVVELDELRAELAEIDENIVRKQLTAFEEAIQLSRRKEIYEALHPEVKHGTNQHTRSRNNCDSSDEEEQPQSFTDNTSQQTGKSKRTVEMKTRIGKLLEPIQDLITGSPIENTQKELDALTKIADPKKGEGIEVAGEVLELLISDGLKTVNLAYKRYNQQRAAQLKQVEEQKPEEPSRPQFDVQQGQVWRCGKHTVICADINDLNHIEADALITDPPYGIDYRPDWNKWDGDGSDFRPVIGDDQAFDPAPFMHFPTVFFFGANYFSDRLPLGGWLCWDKRVNPDLDNMIGSPFELGWYRSQRTTRKAVMVREQHGGVVNADSINGNNDKRHHPTQKPVSVMREILLALTHRTDTVLDPFSGSGSTLLACELLGQQCTAIEIDPHYVRIILERFYTTTNIEPCLESFV